MKIIRASSCQFFNFRQKDYVTFFFLYNILAIHHFSKCITKLTQSSSKHTQNLLLNIFRIIVEIILKFVIIATSTSLQFILKSPQAKYYIIYNIPGKNVDQFFFLIFFCHYSLLVFIHHFSNQNCLEVSVRNYPRSILGRENLGRYTTCVLETSKTDVVLNHSVIHILTFKLKLFKKVKTYRQISFWI